MEIAEGPSRRAGVQLSSVQTPPPGTAPLQASAARTCSIGGVGHENSCRIKYHQAVDKSSGISISHSGFMN